MTKMMGKFEVCVGNFWSNDGFFSVIGEGGGYFLTTTEFIVEIFCSLKMFCFNFFFHFRFTLIVWEFKEVADEKNGDDNEDEDMRLISVNLIT